MQNWLKNVWQGEDYSRAKQISFDLLDSFLTKPPKNILDIGCGLAFESEMFQQKYNSNLYLLDGDFESTANISRDRDYSATTPLAFYSKITDLTSSFDSRKIRYNFINANAINLEKNLIFDFVFSNVSCGYHYPLSVYADLLRKHTNKNSIMVFDIHSRYFKEQIDPLFDVLEIKNYPGQKKIIKCQVKFKGINEL
jgi:SAM-dependent methyltransferase